MSDWKFINAGRQTKPSHVVPPHYCSTNEDGFNGLFRLTIDGTLVRVLASDGEGWRHVSVSLEYQPNTCPSWNMMCKVKDLFFEPDDVVMQFHPRHKDYVNFHKGCLHLWQPWMDGAPVSFPTPPHYLVGPKQIKTI